MMNKPLNLEFVKAAKDYAGLLNKNYPQKSLLKLVGDRYQLSREERSMLYRGVVSEKMAEKRKSKIIHKIPDDNEIIYVDFFNQLYHVISYLKGNRVFISMDGFVKDASEVHGKKIQPGLINKAIQLFGLYIFPNIQNQLVFYVDEQLHLFSEIVEQINQSDALMNERITVRATSFVDKELASQTCGIVATSDSQIVDNTSLYVFDLARNILVFHFQPDFLSLSSIVR